METLPSIKKAELPQLYQNARMALAKCAKVDECQNWSDKAKALASYAKQSQDHALFHYAKRIAVRATQRVGLLLKEIPSAQKVALKQGARRVAGDLTGRFAIGKAAGLSAGQVKTALRVASVPALKFERLVEGDEPPTISEMAKLGTTKREEITARPDGFAETTQILGALRRLEEKLTITPRKAAAALLDDDERKSVGAVARKTAKWLDEFNEILKGA